MPWTDYLITTPEPPILMPDIEATILESVNVYNGIRDTILTMEVLVKIGPSYTDPSMTSAQAAAMVAKTIHRMIHEGKLVAIDCETPNSTFSYILPAGSRAIIAMPVYIKDTRTCH